MYLAPDLLCAMTAISHRPARRPFVDFASVPVSQWRMHDRLVNWSRWAHGDSGQAARLESATPMFRLFKADNWDREYGRETSVPIDKEDAIRVAKAVGHLPMQKRRAVHWYYLEGGRHPSGKARELEVELRELADLVLAARVMLIGWVGV